MAVARHDRVAVENFFDQLLDNFNKPVFDPHKPSESTRGGIEFPFDELNVNHRADKRNSAYERHLKRKQAWVEGEIDKVKREKVGPDAEWGHIKAGIVLPDLNFIKQVVFYQYTYANKSVLDEETTAKVVGFGTDRISLARIGRAVLTNENPKILIRESVLHAVVKMLYYNMDTWDDKQWDVTQGALPPEWKGRLPEFGDLVGPSMKSLATRIGPSVYARATQGDVACAVRIDNVAEDARGGVIVIQNNRSVIIRITRYTHTVASKGYVTNTYAWYQQSTYILLEHKEDAKGVWNACFEMIESFTTDAFIDTFNPFIDCQNSDIKALLPQPLVNTAAWIKVYACSDKRHAKP